MTTMSRNRADAHAVWIGVAKGLGILAGIALVGGIVFFCFFILLAAKICGAKRNLHRRQKRPRKIHRSTTMRRSFLILTVLSIAAQLIQG